MELLGIASETGSLVSTCDSCISDDNRNAVLLRAVAVNVFGSGSLTCGILFSLSSNISGLNVFEEHVNESAV